MSSPLVLYGLQAQSNDARMAALALQEKQRQALANQQTALGYYQTNARLQGQREALTAAAARDANAQAERRYELAGTLASRDLSERRSLDQRANEYNAGAQERMMGRDQQERETDARLWEQGRQFDAGQTERASEFRQTGQQREYEFEAGKDFEADRTKFLAAKDEAARQEQYGQQRDMVGLATQADVFKNQQHAETAAWLSQQQLSQAERMHLQQELNKVGAINADEHLLPDEKADMITQIRTGIDPLMQRAKRTQVQMEQEQVKKMQAAAAHVKAIEAQNDAFDAGNIGARVKTDPATGETWFSNRDGSLQHVPYNNTRPGIEAKHQADEAERVRRQHEADTERDWKAANEYIRDNTNPETGATPTFEQALGEVKRRRSLLTGGTPDAQAAPFQPRRTGKPFDVATEWGRAERDATAAGLAAGSPQHALAANATFRLRQQQHTPEELTPENMQAALNEYYQLKAAFGPDKPAPATVRDRMTQLHNLVFGKSTEGWRLPAGAAPAGAAPPTPAAQPGGPLTVDEARRRGMQVRVGPAGVYATDAMGRRLPVVPAETITPGGGPAPAVSAPAAAPPAPAPARGGRKSKAELDAEIAAKRAQIAAAAAASAPPPPTLQQVLDRKISKFE